MNDASSLAFSGVSDVLDPAAGNARVLEFGQLEHNTMEVLWIGSNRSETKSLRHSPPRGRFSEEPTQPPEQKR